MSESTEMTIRPNLAPAWKPGQSGNPGGRKPVPPELMKKMVDFCPEVVDFHMAVMRNPRERTPERQKSGTFLWEYVYGKPIQDMNIGGQADNPIMVARPLAGLTDGQIQQLKEILRNVNPTGLPLLDEGSILD